MAFETVSYFVNGLAHGPHVVSLSGLPAACNAGGLQRDVNLRGDDTALVVFNIHCTRTTGDLRVAVTTTGTDADPDGYLVLINQVPATFVPSNGQTTLQFLPAGTYSVALSDIAPNCTGGTPQSATITAGLLSTVNFTVSCTPVAIVKVTASVDGADPDPDGVTFRLDQSQPIRVANGTTHLRVPSGSRTWEIADVQPNCSLGGPTSGSFTIAAGDTVEIDAAASCVAVGYGTAGTTASDPSADTLSNPTGHADPAHDLLQITTRYATNWLILVMRFAKPVGSVGLATPAGLQGWLELDVDENLGTGMPPGINSFGGNAQQGVDYAIALFEADASSVRIHRVGAGFDTTAHRVPLQIEGDSVIIRIPLAKLGGDDGNLSITSVVGTADRPTDIAPNSGVILARQPTGSVVASATAGADAALLARVQGGSSAKPRRWGPRQD